MRISDAIAGVIEGRDLDEAHAEAVMDQIMQGAATPAQIGGFLIGLRMKGETVAEITGFARAMRRSAIPVTPACGPLVDTCGTGGDQAGTFNISTTAAFVASGTGLRVAKHGNRSVSSRCGSADVLDALGVRLDLSPGQVAGSIDEVGIGFLYAPRLHPAMKHAIGPRREMGVRTVFNLLGPLTNPAGAQSQVLGLYDGKLTETIARVLLELGAHSAFVVHGADGLDELSTTGANRVTRLADGAVSTCELDPVDLGIARSRLSDYRGGDPPENAAILRGILRGEAGPRRDIVVLNSAAVLIAGGAATDWLEGLNMARESIDTGAAQSRLDALVDYTNSVGAA
jgi:anthranilate phosphoribosyltransferase